MTIDQRWKKKRTMGPLVSETFLGSAERKKENKEEKRGKEKRKRKETAADGTFIFLHPALPVCICELLQLRGD